MKEIVLDTETTGISIQEGHRIVEIGCLELDNLIPTKRKFHYYLNPERKVSEQALKVHGYNDEFLSKQKKFSEIASTTNINDAKLRMTGPQSTYPVTLTFIKYYGVGSYTRKVEDFVCTKEESHSQGNTFGKCTRDVTEMKDGDDGKPNNDIGTAAAKGSVGDPVLKMEKIKEMVVTIRPASCMNRPAKPSEPWPEKNPDCAWWYTAEGHGGDKWAVDDEKDPQEEVGQPKDDQTYCESGYCFHIDFHSIVKFLKNSWTNAQPY